MLPNDFVWKPCFSTPDIMSISIYGVDFFVRRADGTVIGFEGPVSKQDIQTLLNSPSYEAE